MIALRSQPLERKPLPLYLAHCLAAKSTELDRRMLLQRLLAHLVVGSFCLALHFLPSENSCLAPRALVLKPCSVPTFWLTAYHTWSRSIDYRVRAQTIAFLSLLQKLRSR
jgi:hypothetical protein